VIFIVFKIRYNTMGNNILKKGLFSNLFSRYLSKRYLSIRVVFILDLFLSTLSLLLVLFLAESVLKIQYESNSFILLCCLLSFME
jgi:hypothetical protein